MDIPKRLQAVLYRRPVSTRFAHARVASLHGIIVRAVSTIGNTELVATLFARSAAGGGSVDDGSTMDSCPAFILVFYQVDNQEQAGLLQKKSEA
jgi:hypothetical protein